MVIEWWMIDGLIGLLILAAAIWGSVRGISDTIIRIGSMIGGIVLGVMFSDRISAFLMGTKMSSSLHEHIFMILRGEAPEGVDPASGEAALETAGDEAASFQESLSRSLDSMFDSAADRAADAAAQKLTEIAVSLIGFALILIAVAIAAAVIRHLIKQGRKTSLVIGFTDRLLGFVLGGVRGLLIAWVVVALMVPVTTLLSPEALPGLIAALQQTTVAKVLYDVNPLLLIVKYVLR